MQRIKAFTIMELIVVLLVSIILFGIAFLSLSIIQNRYSYFATLSGKIIEMDKLNHLLKQDFERSHYLKANSYELHCLQDSAQISYIWEKEYVLRRQNEITDTFHLAIPEVRMYMQNREISSTQGFIDNLEFTSEYKGEEFKFNVTKNYTNSELMEMGVSFN